MRVIPRPVVRTAFLALAMALAPGCGSIVDSLTGAYTGPPPSRDDISSETVVIRVVNERPETGIQFFVVDRERFLTTAPHDINRVVEVTSRDIQPRVTPMELKVGDRVRISTTFLSYREAGGLSQHVPDWPFDKYWEYPIGLHLLTSIEREVP